MNNCEKIKNYHEELDQSVKNIKNLIINTPLLERIKHPLKLVKNYHIRYGLENKKRKFDSIYSRLTYYGIRMMYLRNDEDCEQLLHSYNVYEKKLVKYMDKHPFKR